LLIKIYHGSELGIFISSNSSQHKAVPFLNANLDLHLHTLTWQLAKMALVAGFSICILISPWFPSFIFSDTSTVSVSESTFKEME